MKMTKYWLVCTVFSVFLAGSSSVLWAAEHGGGEKTEKAKEGEHGAEGGGEGKKEKNTDITGGRFAGDPVYVHLAPFNLSIVRKYGAEQLATFVIDLQVKDMKVANDLYMQMPKIKDNLLETLYIGLGNGSLLTDGLILNLTKIKEKCRENLSKLYAPIYGEDAIQGILIQDVSQRLM